MSEAADLLALVRRIRKTLGLWIVGEQFVTVTPSRWKVMTTEGFMALPDGTLGRMFRQAYAQIAEGVARKSETDGYYFAGAMNASSILWLASSMVKARGAQASYSVTGSLDGGQTEGCWSVYVCEGDIETADGVDIQHAPDDPDRITRLSIQTRNPGYAAWVKARAQTPSTASAEGE